MIGRGHLVINHNHGLHFLLLIGFHTGCRKQEEGGGGGEQRERWMIKRCTVMAPIPHNHCELANQIASLKCGLYLQISWCGKAYGEV